MGLRGVASSRGREQVKNDTNAPREGLEGLRSPSTTLFDGIHPTGHAEKGLRSARASSRAHGA